MTKQEAEKVIKHALEMMYDEGGNILRAWDVIVKELRKVEGLEELSLRSANQCLEHAIKYQELVDKVIEEKELNNV